MTSKNTDNFTVDVTNRQSNNGETEQIKESGNGSLRFRNGKHYLMYKTDTATVMIRIEGDRANVKRTGENHSDMDYKPGEITRFMYNTPYGAMEMELYTRSLEYEFNATGGVIKLQYNLCGTENDMEIKIKKG